MTSEQVPAYAMALMEMAQTNVKRHAKDLQLYRPRLSDRQRRALLAEALHDLRRAIELVERYDADLYEPQPETT
jgi:hypothetical protein